MSEKYRLAIAGAGVIAQEHLRVLGKLPNVELAAICDTDEEKVKRTAHQWGIADYYKDFSEMLSVHSPHIVSILTPPHSHPVLAVEALKHESNVLIEKPMTLTTREAGMILDTLKETHLKLTVVYHYLFSRAIQKALRLVRSGGVGEILNVNVTLLGEPRDDAMGSNPRHWSHGIPGGRFGEMISHPIYLLQAFLGEDLKLQDVAPAKRGQRPWMLYDEMRLMLSANKGTGTVYLSYNAPRTAEFVDVFGTEQILRVDMTNQNVVSLGRRTLSKLDSALDLVGTALQLTASAARNAFQFVQGARGEYALNFLYRAFLECIQNDTEPPVTPELAYRTVKIAEEVCKLLEPVKQQGS